MRGVYISGLQRIVVGSSKMLNELMLQGSMIRTQVLAPGRALTTSVGVREWLGGVGQSLAMVLVLLLELVVMALVLVGKVALAVLLAPTTHHHLRPRAMHRPWPAATRRASS